MGNGISVIFYRMYLSCLRQDEITVNFAKETNNRAKSFSFILFTAIQR